jgi:hypothetical protein
MSPDVIDNVIAEHRAGIRVGLLNRRSGEPDERGIRERVPHVPSEAVYVVILAVVRLISYDNDILAI